MIMPTCASLNISTNCIASPKLFELTDNDVSEILITCIDYNCLSSIGRVLNFNVEQRGLLLLFATTRSVVKSVKVPVVEVAKRTN